MTIVKFGKHGKDIEIHKLCEFVVNPEWVVLIEKRQNVLVDSSDGIYRDLKEVVFVHLKNKMCLESPYSYRETLDLLKNNLFSKKEDKNGGVK